MTALMRCFWWSVKMEVTKEIIIHAIYGGTIIPLGGISDRLTPWGGTTWYWRRSELDKMQFNELLEIYNKYRREDYP